MKELQRLGLIVLFAVGLACCTQKSPPGFKAGSEPDGFGNVKWGTEFSEVKSDMVELRSTNDPAQPNEKITIYYARKGDALKIGEAQVDAIEYMFWRGKFAEVRIAALGNGNFENLKKFLFERYGTVEKPFQGTYSWDGSVTQVALRYDERTQTSLLRIVSTKMASQEVKEMFEKDKD